MFFYNLIAPLIYIVAIHIIAALGVMQIIDYPN